MVMDLRQVKQLFQTAAAMPAERRVAWLAEQAATPEVRAQVEAQLSMLEGESSDFAVVARPVAEPPPRQIDRYELLAELGEGGFGTVFLAEQREPVHRKVALKLLRKGMDSAQIVARFAAERQALALMDHPHIATVFDGGATADGRPYFVMEYVDGLPITEYCDRHALGTDARLLLFTKVCAAINHAHQKGVIHRDLKPSNVLVAERDGVPVPKVIDFGIAKATSVDPSAVALTEQLQLVGTLEYMAPEQAEPGGRGVDVRADVYSLGVLLYELLTGTTPIERSALQRAGYLEVMRALREQEPEKPSTRITRAVDLAATARLRSTTPQALPRELRGDLDWIVLRALDKEPDRRYATAAEFAADITRHRNDEPVTAGSPSVRHRLRKFVRRHRPAVAAVTLIAVTLIAGVVVSLRYAVEAHRQRDFAVAERQKAERVQNLLVGTLGMFNLDLAEAPTVTENEFLARVAKAATYELRDQPEVEADIRTRIGVAFWTRGQLGLAAEQLQRALDILDASADPAPERMHEVLWAYGTLTYQNGSLQVGDLWQRSGVFAMELVGRDAPRLRSAVRGVRSWAAQLNLETPFPAGTLAELLTLATEQLPPRDPRWIALGDVLFAAGIQVSTNALDHVSGERFLEVARDCFERADRAALKPSHLRLGLVREEMLQVLYRAGRLADGRAESLARDALATLVPALPEGHWYPAVFHSWLGIVLAQQPGREVEAQAELERGDEKLAAVLGPASYLTTTPLVELIRLYARAGREDLAHPLRVRLAGSLAQTSLAEPQDRGYVLAALGPGFDRVGSCITELDALRFVATAKDDVGARAALDALLDACNTDLTGDDARRRAIAYWLTLWAGAQLNRAGSSPTVSRRALEWARDVLRPVDSPGLCFTYFFLAAACSEGDDPAATVAVAEEGLAFLERIGGSGFHDANLRRQLGRALLLEGDTARVFDHLLASYRATRRLRGFHDANTGIAFAWLASGCAQAGRIRLLTALATERLLDLDGCPLPSQLNSASWWLALLPGLDADACRIARHGIDQALRFRPDDPGLVNTLGLVALRSGDRAEAIRVIQRNDELRRKSGSGSNSSDQLILAIAYAGQGQTTPARLALDRARALLGPDGAKVGSDIAVLLAEAERVLSAR